jgi:Fe-S-cluster containining protein
VWLGDIRRAIAGEADADVPCDGCTACCTSSQFVHVAPDEAGALAHIPAELLFPAPGLPTGHRLMGYDERGHCPMLVDGRCSIYAHRPRTCRSYDCRVFAATGLDPGADKPAIADRVTRWRFDQPTAADRVAAAACRAAAAYLRARAGELPIGRADRNPVALAALAIEVHGAFLGGTGAPDGPVLEPDVAVVRSALEARRGR